MAYDVTQVDQEGKPAGGRENTSPTLSAPEAARRAQKRTEIGLAPSRPTARAAVQRPPRTGFSALQQWLLILLTGALLLTTAVMVMAKLADAPTAWPVVSAYWRSWLQPQRQGTLGAYRPGEGYRLRIGDDFAGESTLVAGAQATGAWWTALVPAEGLYRMRIWPAHLTWSTIAIDGTQPYRIDASVTIVDLMPEGYSGFIARYQDAQNFYLFMVDGAGRYQLQLWQGGRLQTLQPWLANPALNQAGVENVLGVEDDGQTLRFFGNGVALYAIDAPQLAPGSVGLLGGAAERTMAEINVDWIRIYDFVQ